MSTDPNTALSLDEYQPGTRYVVTGVGARLYGATGSADGHSARNWSYPLSPGDIITCLGPIPNSGVEWASEKTAGTSAPPLRFVPAVGPRNATRPAAGYLVREDATPSASTSSEADPEPVEAAESARLGGAGATGDTRTAERAADVYAVIGLQT